MHIPARWSSLSIWLISGVFAVLSCSLTLHAAHPGDEYVPVGNDSFYHARRILDTVQNPSGFYEFDSRMHAPEGSLLSWPWGYDRAMATLVRIGLAAGISSDPMAILAWIPVGAVFISIGLLVLIATRLQLPAWPTAIAALCMALAPTTQLLHGPGEVDHHFAEMIFWLAMLAAGLGWLQEPSSWRRASLLGALVGVAPAIHNGLFILQLPILAATFALWLQNRRIPSRAGLAFAAMLMIATVAVLIPSLPFRSGRFEFYTLSWFHLYVAGCSAAAMILMGRLSFTRTGVLVLLLALGVLSMPLVSEMSVAGTFLGGMHRYLENIDEMRSPASAAMKLGYMSMARVYSFLIYVAPLTFVLCVVQCWRDRASPRVLFWITASVGLALLSTQQRMHYFGDFALYLPWLVLATDVANKHPQRQKQIFLGASLAALLLYAPVLRYQLLAPMPPANDVYFSGMRPLYATLREACARQPGTVLADNNAGHPIRFYTDCSVIANNFLLTPQHLAKVEEVDRLFSLSAAELARQPRIQYVLIRVLAMRQLDDGTVQYKLFFPNTSGLASELLFSPATSLPPNYTLLREVSFAGQATYARLFKIEHAP